MLLVPPPKKKHNVKCILRDILRLLQNFCVPLYLYENNNVQQVNKTTLPTF